MKSYWGHYFLIIFLDELDFERNQNKPSSHKLDFGRDLPQNLYQNKTENTVQSLGCAKAKLQISNAKHC